VWAFATGAGAAIAGAAFGRVARIPMQAVLDLFGQADSDGPSRRSKTAAGESQAGSGAAFIGAVKFSIDWPWP